MDQNVLNELNLKLEAIDLKNNIIKDEKESNQDYQDIELQIKELRNKQKEILENTIPDVLSELEMLKKEYKEALDNVAKMYSSDKKTVAKMKKRISKFNKLKYQNKFPDFAVEVAEILDLNKGE